MKNLSFSIETPLFKLTVGELLEILRQEQAPPAIVRQIPEIFGIATLQEITGYSKASIYLKTSTGNIPHFKRDGKLFFRHSEILEWLQENRVKTVSEKLHEMDSQLTRRAKA